MSSTPTAAVGRRRPRRGAAHSPSGMENSIIGTEANDSRIPGRRFDAETGLHCNDFRDYEPTYVLYIQFVWKKEHRVIATDSPIR